CVSALGGAAPTAIGCNTLGNRSGPAPAGDLKFTRWSIIIPSMGRVSDARQRLLEAAIALIWEQSYGSVTVDAICEKAGVRKGSFYHFFKSKADLAAAALEAHWQSVRPELDRIFSATVPPLERLKNYFQFIYFEQRLQKEKTGQVLGCPYTCVGAELVQQEKIVCKKAQELLTRYSQYFESALRDAAAAGLIPPRDVRAKAKGLFAYLEGVLLQARIRNDVELIRQLSSGALDMIGAKITHR